MVIYLMLLPSDSVNVVIGSGVGLATFFCLRTYCILPTVR